MPSLRRALQITATAATGVGVLANPLGYPIALAALAGLAITAQSREHKASKAHRHYENQAIATSLGARSVVLSHEIKLGAIAQKKSAIMRSIHPSGWAKAFKAAGVLEYCEADLVAASAWLQQQGFGGAIVEGELVQSAVRSSQPNHGALNWASEPIEWKPTDIEYFPTVDLAKELARSFLNPENASSVLIACPRRTGKTKLLESTIRWFHKLTKGQGVVNVFNGKETFLPSGKLKDDFCGLAYDSRRYLAVEKADAVEEFHDRLETLHGLMSSKGRDYYILNILDELNNMLIATNAYDMAQKPDFKLGKHIIPKNIQRATAGSSRKMCDIITSHSPYVDAIGIDKSMQDNYVQIVLARSGYVEAVIKAFKGGGGGRSIISDDDKRSELFEQFQKWAGSEGTHRDRVVALTNLGGWRLVYLPVPSNEPEPPIKIEPKHPLNVRLNVRHEETQEETAPEDEEAIAQGGGEEAADKKVSGGSDRFSAEYREYLASEHWQERRSRIIKRDGGLCQKCIIKGVRTRGTDVHHLFYPGWNASLSDFIEQSDDQLKLLCSPCHRVTTKEMRSGRKK